MYAIAERRVICCIACGCNNVIHVVIHTQTGYGAAHDHGHQPNDRDLDERASLRRTVPGAERIPDARVAADADEAHVQNASRTGEHVARHVDVAPREAERPVAYIVNESA